MYREDSLYVAEQGPDFMGWIVSPRSPRKIRLQEITPIIEEIRNLFPAVYHAAVFADNSSDEILDIFSSGIFDLFQIASDPGFFLEVKKQIENRNSYDSWIEKGPIRGDRPALCPAVRVSSKIENASLLSWGNSPLYILDSYVPGRPGGTGKILETDFVREITLPYLLAGGLKPDNVKDRLESSLAAGADVSSGIEDSPGKKNKEKLKSFIKIVRALKR